MFHRSSQDLDGCPRGCQGQVRVPGLANAQRLGLGMGRGEDAWLWPLMAVSGHMCLDWAIERDVQIIVRPTQNNDLSQQGIDK